MYKTSNICFRTIDTYEGQLLHVLLQEFPVKIIPDCVVNETLRGLSFPTSLIFEDNIVIPSAQVITNNIMSFSIIYHLWIELLMQIFKLTFF